jgi:hypothetical protein
LKLLKERVEHTLELIGRGGNFLNRTPVGQQLRERIDKWDHKKLNSFFPAKETFSTLKRQSDKMLISRIYREIKILNSQRINDPMKKWAKEV